jgi:hypothetical protein
LNGGSIMANEWFVRAGNTEHGPFSSEALKQLVREGKVTPAMFVKKEASGTWFSASAVKGLFASPAGGTSPRSIPSGNQPSHSTPVPSSASPAPGHQDSASDSEGGGIPKWMWLFIGAAAVFLCALGIYAVREQSQKAEQARIEAANQEVREAVEKAQKWIQNGWLPDADKIEQGLKAAGANATATDKASVAPTLTAFQKAKGEKQAAAVLKSAIDAISQKQFDKAQRFLRQYLADQHATERVKAQTLLVEIALATSDDDALRTLLTVDDPSFDSLSKGDFSRVVLSHPVLLDTGIETLKRNLAEAGRRREQMRKLEQKRTDEKIALQQRAQREEEERRLAEKRKQEAEERERVAREKEEKRRIAEEIAKDKLTLHNYYQVDIGMTYDQVASFIGPASEISAEAGGEGYRLVVVTWKGSGLFDMRVVTISFTNGKVSAMAQVGLK